MAEGVSVWAWALSAQYGAGDKACCIYTGTCLAGSQIGIQSKEGKLIKLEHAKTDGMCDNCKAESKNLEARMAHVNFLKAMVYNSFKEFAVLPVCSNANRAACPARPCDFIIIYPNTIDLKWLMQNAGF